MEVFWGESDRARNLAHEGCDFRALKLAQWRDGKTCATVRNPTGETLNVSMIPINGEVHVLYWKWKTVASGLVPKGRPRAHKLRQATEDEAAAFLGATVATI